MGGPPPMFFMRLDEEKAARKYPDRVLLAKLVKLAASYRLYFAVLAATVFSRVALSMFNPYVTKFLIDSAVSGNLPALAFWSGVFLILIAAGLVVGFAGDYSSSYLANRVMYDLRSRMYQHLYRVHLSAVAEEPVGRIVSRITNDVDTIGFVAATGLINTLADVLTIGGAMLMMWSLSPQLSLVAYAMLPLIVVANLVVLRRARRAYRETRRKIAEVTSRISQDVAGAAVVQAFSFRRQRNVEEFRRINEENLRANVQAEAASSSMNVAMAAIEALGTVLILVYGGNLVMRGLATVGTLVAFYGYLASFFRPLRMLVMFLTTLQSTMAAAERVFIFLEEWKPEPDEGDVSEPPQLGEVEFRDVVFGYKEGQPVLKGVSFKVKPGEFAAIVGPTGAGKTTIVSLLLRFYEPWSGQILIDGVDVRRYKLSALRSAVLMIPQEPLLVSGTVLENILLANPEATREEVEAAIKALGLWDLVESLPQGLDTPVLEGGKNLSVGQRQLVSLLRVFVANPRILVLDEATSSIDPRTEARLQAALEKLIEGRTAVVIAHRLQTIVRADHIIVIEDGRVVEEGRHEELLAKGGVYAKLYGIQMAAAEAARA
ncbi:MAG: ABC transporter ATP-binding protein/permease [Thermofilum sp.]|nr:ABC transporter ATP-binding protein/permease [Thermofilum sp.]MCC6065017.1 ABC transporter ATP-binding protein/permease [Thermofilum sp.]